MVRRKEKRRPLPRKPGWRDVSDEFWAEVETLIPPDPRGPEGGRPATDHRKILNGILYVLRTGCQWKMLPHVYGSGSTAHEHFQKWACDGVFGRMWKRCLQEYDGLQGIDWTWQSIDSVTVSAPVKRGMRRAKTPRIAGNSAPSDISTWTGMASRSA